MVTAGRGRASTAWRRPTLGPLREAEERAAAAAVGVDVVEFLGHQDGMVEYGLALRRDIARAIRRHRPELVVTVHFGLAWGPRPGGAANQADHRHVGLAVLDACRDAGNRWIFPEQLTEGLRALERGQLAGRGRVADPHPWRRRRRRPTSTLASRSLEAHGVYLAGLGTDFDVRGFLEEPCRASRPGGGHRAGRRLRALLAERALTR